MIIHPLFNAASVYFDGGRRFPQQIVPAAAVGLSLHRDHGVVQHQCTRPGQISANGA